MPDVIVIMGSASDIKYVQPCLELLRELGIDYMATVSSAHRTPERTERLVRDHAEARVFICAAGMAAHLAGAVAARTLKPVIGLPIASQNLGGMDALFSTVQMPAGFPVATVALNGAKNAAWLAAQILALNNDALREKIEKARQAMRSDVENAANELDFDPMVV